MFFGVPTMYVRLLEQAARRRAAGASAVGFGFGRTLGDLYGAFQTRFGAQILERYGATEFGFALTNRYGGPRVAGTSACRSQRCGSHRRARMRRRCRAGEVGELLVAGPSLFKGYWKIPEATAAAFATDQEGRAGIAAAISRMYDEENGVYRIVGRLKELIITGGFNVYPREIEIEIERSRR